MKDLTCLLIGRVGDVIVCTPFLRGLRRRFPQARIRLVVGYRSRQVLPLIPFIDASCVLEKPLSFLGHARLAWALLRGPCDLLIDLNPSFSKTSTILARALPARERLSFDKGRGPAVFSRTVAAPGEREPMAERYRRLAQALDAPYSPETELLLPAADVAQAQAELAAGPGFKIAIHPGNFDRFSFRWPEEKFAALTDRLLDDARLRLFYVAGPGEEEPVREIVSALKRPVPILPPSRLGVTGAMLKRMDLFVCNITGTTHLAAALGVPTFGFYAGYTQAVWRPAWERHGGTVCPEWESCRETTVEEAYSALTGHIQKLA